MTSTALLTDQYELTMVSAALAAGTADRRCVFEVFARRLPDGRRYGVFERRYAVFPQNRRLPLRVRLLIDHLRGCFGRPDYWRGGA